MYLNFIPRLLCLFALLGGCFVPLAHGAEEPAAQSSSYDVVVYGGVPCGIAASISAARSGATVLLIEPTKHVGGLSTSGINTAESEHMLKWTIGGFALEFYERLGKHYGTNKAEYYFESSVAEKVYLEMLAEAKVPVRYELRVTKVEKTGTKIDRIVLSDGSTVSGKVFIDAGYEGDLAARAGVTMTFGREAKATYNESFAGVRLDKTPRKAATVNEAGELLPGISDWAKNLTEGAAHPATMNYNFRLTVTQNKDNMVPIPAPKQYDRARYRLLENWLRGKSELGEKVVLKDILDLYKRRNGKFEMNNTQLAIISLGHFGGQFGYPDADYEQRDKIYADHLNYTLGLLHFLATDEAVPANLQKEMQSWGLTKDEFTDNGNLPYQLYVREARRMIGEYVVKQQDVIDDRRKQDSIGISSHFIDCHHVQRVAPSPTEFVNEGRIWRIGYAYQMPYRALTPKAAECTNLLVPGAASFSHVAFCTYRLESVWMIGGQAAGVAAAQASQQQKPVQELDVSALQAALKQGQQVIDFIPGQPEKFPGGSGWPEF